MEAEGAKNSGVNKFGERKPEFFHGLRIRSINSDPQAGFYLIDKPKGVHSFKAVSTLRRILQIKKVGFAGTLDPLASGLLILATGQATRLLDVFHYLPKIYQADVLFGQTSDTYDREGQININSQAREFSPEELENKLKNFVGPQEQIVPIYSAKKVAGRKLHELARRGKIVPAPTTKIEIYKLVIKKFNWPGLSLEIECSAGTYMRSLAHDLGQTMGTGALLSDLRRQAIGHFSVKNALPLEQASPASLAQYYLRPADIIKSLQQYFFLGV